MKRYEPPIAVSVIYIFSALAACCAVAAVALGLATRSSAGWIGLGLLGNAIFWFLIGYGLNLLARLVFELQALRAESNMRTGLTTPAAISSTAPAMPLREDFKYFYYLGDEVQEESLPLSELIEKMNDGVIHPSTRVQREGSANWVELRSCVSGI